MSLVYPSAHAESVQLLGKRYIWRLGEVFQVTGMPEYLGIGIVCVACSAHTSCQPARHVMLCGVFCFPLLLDLPSHLYVSPIGRSSVIIVFTL